MKPVRRITMPGGIALGHCFIAVLLAGTACAQGYPAKPVRVVVPWPAGGGVDTVARTLGQKLGESLGQPFVVDNRSGATGTIGTEFAAKAAPDGYTLLASSPPIIYTASLYPKLNYHPVNDFTPISMTVMMPFYFVAHPSVPARTVRELITLAKLRPGTLSYASSGTGSGGHLLGELLKQRAGIDLLHVPYKGTAPALSDTIGGQTALFFSDPSAIGMIRAGRLRVLAVTTAKRSATLPEVPTLVESGIAGFDVWNWYPMLGPAGMPRDVVQRLNAEIVRILALPDVRERLLALGLDPASSTPEALGAHMRGEYERWTPVIKSAGIRFD